MEHIAELSPTDDPTLCQMLRIVEVRDGRPVGYAQQGESKNMNVPEPFVPHPDTYGDFPDVETAPSRLCRQLRQWGANVKE